MTILTQKVIRLYIQLEVFKINCAIRLTLLVLRLIKLILRLICDKTFKKVLKA